jgi:hypothetical protein
MAVFRINLVMQELDTTKPAGDDALGEPIELEVGLIAAPNYEQMKALMAEMLEATAEEFREANDA